MTPRIPRVPPHFWRRPFLTTWGLNLLGLGLNLYFAWWNLDHGYDVSIFINCLGAAIGLHTIARVARITAEDWRTWRRMRAEVLALLSERSKRPE